MDDAIQLHIWDADRGSAYCGTDCDIHFISLYGASLAPDSVRHKCLHMATERQKIAQQKAPSTAGDRASSDRTG